MKRQILDRSSRLLRRPLFVIGAAVVVALGVYANSLSNGFAYDDHYLVEENPDVHGLDSLPRILTREYWTTDVGAGLYRPVTLLSFAVDWALWDGKPLGFHLTNVLLHALVTGLITLLLLRWFPPWGALLGGLVFAVHPVHTEAVANVAGRAELLAATFVLLACLVYLRGPTAPERHRARSIAVIAVCYALATLSKEGAIVLPALLPALDLIRLRTTEGPNVRDYLRSRLPLFAALAVVLALVLALRWTVLGSAVESVPARAFEPDDSFPTRLFTMARVWPLYFELLLAPLDLSADYTPGVIVPAGQLTLYGAVGFLLVLGTLGLAAAAYRREPRLTAAVAWAAIALLPVSNLFFTAEIVLAERTLYLPSVAVSVVAALVSRLPRARTIATVALTAWIVGFGTITVRRNPVWKSTVTVFESLRQDHPESSRLLWEVGRWLEETGRWDEARHYFDLSLQVWPFHAPYYRSYALELAERAHWHEADSLAGRAIDLHPREPGYHQLRAVLRLRAGRHAAAAKAARTGIRAAGPDPVLRTVLAESLAGLGDFRAAARAQRTALEGRVESTHWREWLQLAQFYAAAGDTTAALDALGSARDVADAPVAALDSLERALTRARAP